MRLPYLWIRLGPKQLGIVPDSGMKPLFSERYGYTRVWRGLRYKVIWQDASKHCIRFRLWLAERARMG